MSKEDSNSMDDHFVPESTGNDSEDDEYVMDKDLVANDIVNDNDGEDSKAQEEAPRGSTMSLYGVGLSAEGASDIASAAGGLIWHAQVVHDNFNDKRHCNPDGTIKPRRPLPHVKASDFFKSLNKSAQGHWIFSGVLNGWPTMTNLELLSITGKVKGVLKPKIVRFWDVGAKSGQKDPGFPERATSVRVTFRQPAWTTYGWSKDSLGALWWYFGEQDKKELQYGENIVRKFQEDSKNGQSAQAVEAAFFRHRYWKPKEGAKDKLTYHAGVFFTWDHGKWGTVIELGWLNGVGGYHGKSNWQHDKNEAKTAMWSCMDDKLKAPWRSEYSELRATDVPCKTIAEFKDYLKQYTGSRFADVGIEHEGPVRLSFRSQEHIARYLINYISRDRVYSEARRNCQHFAADWYGFVAGKKDIMPYAQISKALYRQRHYMFIQDPNMNLPP